MMFSKLYLLVATATIASAASVSADCTFVPQCDYGKGSRSVGPAASQEECCTQCTNRPACAAGVFDGSQCWYKTAEQVKGGCQKSKRVKASCLPPSVKPGPAPPPPPPPPPSPKPPPGPPKPPAPPPPPLPPLPPTPPSAKCGTGEKPVQVFILMGQSNMLGEGAKGPVTKVNSLAEAVQTNKKYPYLWSNGNWTTSKNVRNVFVMGSGGMSSATSLMHNEMMTAALTTPDKIPGFNSKSKSSIGPELGIGFALGAYTQDPVMTLKSCIGDRALGWDLLPPGSKEWEYTAPGSNNTYIYAGYHESPNKWLKGAPKPPPIGWAAGIQYDGDLYRANMVLGNLSTFYPGSTCYEVAGFFWWQGDRDSRDMGMSTEYETNLVAIIKALRLQYNAPNAKFVTASLGQTKQGSTDGGGLILDAMENVANATKYPAFKGNVAAVYTNPLMHTPGSSGGHYGHDAYTYMNVGEAMGAAMVGLLKGSE